VNRQSWRPWRCVALALWLGTGAGAAAAQPRPADGSRLPGPTYPEVASLSRSGDKAAALSALERRLAALGDDSIPPEALVLRARLLADNQRQPESTSVWQDVLAREPGLRSLALTGILENQISQGDVESAQTTLGQLGAPSGSPPIDLLLKVASACRTAGEVDRAVALYRRARQGAGRSASGDAAALGLIATLEDAGRAADALDEALALRQDFQTPAAYAQSIAATSRLSASLGRSVAPPTERQFRTTAGRLSAATAFRPAIEVLGQWRTAYPDSAELASIDADIIENLYNARANVEARARCSLYLDRYPAGPRAGEVRVTQFRIEIREGRTAVAKSLGLAIWRGPAASVPADDRRSVARLLAEYLVSVGQPEDAIPIYDDLFRATPGRSERIDVLWRSAVAAMRAARQDRAATYLQRVLALNPGSETERAATYWLASIEQARGSRSSAVKRWGSLADRYPYSYYGYRAARRLTALGNPRASETAAPGRAFPDIALSEAAAGSRDYRAAAILARAGLLEDAATCAVRLAQSFRRDPAAALLAARAASAAGEHRTALRLVTSRFGSYLETPTDRLPEDLWSLAYPKPYWTEVQEAANREGVDPYLMLALMQQESQFDAGARSPAGALGLLQIMPATAERIGPALGMGQVPPSELMKPAVSVRLAARLLGDLIRLFGGELAPAIGSYNAGEDRVQAWWDAARGVPEELFIDSIPYRETRGYVREVLANYFTYQRLNAR
jgi:soluble lytic murein transglycosylase-like protein